MMQDWQKEQLKVATGVSEPKREWVGLTADIKDELNNWQSKRNIIDFVEQWLKEKNNG